MWVHICIYHDLFAQTNFLKNKIGTLNKSTVNYYLQIKFILNLYLTNIWKTF